MLVAQETKTAPKANPGVEHVIEALSSGASEDLIIETLRSEGKVYTLTIADLAKLRKAGASDNMIRAMKNPKAEATATSAIASAGPSADSAGLIPRDYNRNWLSEHCLDIDAVNGRTVYFTDNNNLAVGKRFRVYKLAVTVKDVLGEPVEINPVNVGDVTITERRSNATVGTYSGQPITNLEEIHYVILKP
jgi:hypothetical protein